MYCRKRKRKKERERCNCKGKIDAVTVKEQKTLYWVTLDWMFFSDAGHKLFSWICFRVILVELDEWRVQANTSTDSLFVWVINYSDESPCRCRHKASPFSLTLFFRLIFLSILCPLSYVVTASSFFQPHWSIISAIHLCPGMQQETHKQRERTEVATHSLSHCCLWSISLPQPPLLPVAMCVCLCVFQRFSYSPTPKITFDRGETWRYYTLKQLASPLQSAIVTTLTRNFTRVRPLSLSLSLSPSSSLSSSISSLWSFRVLTRQDISCVHKRLTRRETNEGVN